MVIAAFNGGKRLYSKTGRCSGFIALGFAIFKSYFTGTSNPCQIHRKRQALLGQVISCETSRA